MNGIWLHIRDRVGLVEWEAGLAMLTTLLSFNLNAFQVSTGSRTHKGMADVGNMVNDSS